MCVYVWHLQTLHDICNTFKCTLTIIWQYALNFRSIFRVNWFHIPNSDFHIKTKKERWSSRSLNNKFFHSSNPFIYIRYTWQTYLKKCLVPIKAVILKIPCGTEKNIGSLPMLGMKFVSDLDSIKRRSCGKNWLTFYYLIHLFIYIPTDLELIVLKVFLLTVLELLRKCIHVKVVFLDKAVW